MYSGRTQREKDRLAEAITEDLVKILKVGKEEVIVLFYRSFAWKLVFFWSTSIKNKREMLYTRPNFYITGNFNCINPLV